VSSVDPCDRGTVSFRQRSNVRDASVQRLLVFRHVIGLVGCKKLIRLIASVFK
jgi:hypothetical protein